MSTPPRDETEIEAHEPESQSNADQSSASSAASTHSAKRKRDDEETALSRPSPTRIKLKVGEKSGRKVETDTNPSSPPAKRTRLALFVSERSAQVERERNQRALAGFQIDVAPSKMPQAQELRTQTQVSQTHDPETQVSTLAHSQVQSPQSKSPKSQAVSVSRPDDAADTVTVVKKPVPPRYGRRKGTFASTHGAGQLHEQQRLDRVNASQVRPADNMVSEKELEAYENYRKLRESRLNWRDETTNPLIEKQENSDKAALAKDVNQIKKVTRKIPAKQVGTQQQQVQRPQADRVPPLSTGEYVAVSRRNWEWNEYPDFAATFAELQSAQITRAQIEAATMVSSIREQPKGGATRPGADDQSDAQPDPIPHPWEDWKRTDIQLRKDLRYLIPMQFRDNAEYALDNARIVATRPTGRKVTKGKNGKKGERDEKEEEDQYEEVSEMTAVEREINELLVGAVAYIANIRRGRDALIRIQDEDQAAKDQEIRKLQNLHDDGAALRDKTEEIKQLKKQLAFGGVAAAEERKVVADMKHDLEMEKKGWEEDKRKLGEGRSKLKEEISVLEKAKKAAEKKGKQDGLAKAKDKAKGKEQGKGGRGKEK